MSLGIRQSPHSTRLSNLQPRNHPFIPRSICIPLHCNAICAVYYFTCPWHKAQRLIFVACRTVVQCSAGLDREGLCVGVGPERSWWVPQKQRHFPQAVSWTRPHRM